QHFTVDFAMKLSLLLAGTALSFSLLGPAFAQDDATTPEEQVEGMAPAEGGDARAGEPAETQPPNAPDQQPAFPEQTRAPQPAELTPVRQEVIAQNLPQLWAMEFLPDGRMLVTAKQGAMYIVNESGDAGPEISGLPDVDA